MYGVLSNGSSAPVAINAVQESGKKLQRSRVGKISTQTQTRVSVLMWRKGFFLVADTERNYGAGASTVISVFDSRRQVPSSGGTPSSDIQIAYFFFTYLIFFELELNFRCGALCL